MAVTGAASTKIKAEPRAILDALAAHEPEVARSRPMVHNGGVEQRLTSIP